MSHAPVDWGSLLETTVVALLDSADEGIVVFDAEGVCRMMGKKIGELFGVDPRHLVGKGSADVLGALSGACEEPAAFRSMVGQDALQAPARIVGDIEIRSPRRLLVWATQPLACEGAALGRLVLVRDVTRERNAERAQRHLLARIEQLTHVDALTGLANRRRFIEEHEREHGRAMRAWDSYAVVRVDVDGMRTINETYGMPVGDLVLERVGEVLRQGRREYDVVARWENDEFAILLPGADAVAIGAVAQRVLSGLAAIPAAPDSPRPTVCIGGAVCAPPTGESPENVMSRAADARDTARARGTSQTEIDVPSEAKRTPAPP
jgi:diguanylate cyclase (GGDEF)-like protein